MFNLKEMFDSTVKVTLDQSWLVKWPTGCTKTEYDKLERYEIVGKKGTIYPQNLDKNTVCVQTTKRIGKKLLALFGEKAYFKRETDIEFELVIPIDLIKSTFRYIKPKFKRQLTEPQKAALIARLRGVSKC